MLQFLSLLVSCPKSFSLCGGDSTQCVDSYTAIYEAMNVGESINRKDVKQSIMTALYGSKATPLAVFGDNIDQFYETIEHMAPGAWDLNLGLQEIWENIGGSSYEWVLPDNFHCAIEVKVKAEKSFRFLGKDHSITIELDGRPKFHKGLGPNIIHSLDGMVVREMFRRSNYSKVNLTRVINSLDSRDSSGKSSEIVRTLWSHYQDSGYLSARILDYLYEDTMGLVDPLIIAQLIQSLPDEPFDLVTVHDNFRCHPNYGNDVRRQYNLIMADINESNVLSYIVNQLVSSPINVIKVGTIPKAVIQNSNYMLA